MDVNQKEDSNTVKGNPSKELFITMLIKDITLKDAIGDLIDNSVDAAKKCAEDKNDLSNFQININITTDSFSIEDNCGGIEVEIAQKYAFRFGRPKEQFFTPESVGRFGIGMKRAFFKIGSLINITSNAPKSSFELEIDVPKWQKNLDNWDFQFKIKKDNIENELINTFTKININNLTNDAKSIFQLTNFKEELKAEIAKEQIMNIDNGIKININESLLEALLAPKLELKKDKDITPIHQKYSFEGGLDVTILAGVSEDKGEEGGWYIFCNNRLISGPDTSKDTGWKGKGRGGAALYHDQYHRFRGYVFFESSDPSNLPWNTTKTGMDLDSPIYKNVLTKMIFAMNQVIRLMNDLKNEREKGNPKHNQRLSNRIIEAKTVHIKEIINSKDNLSNKFIYPKNLKTTIKKSDKTTIKYEVTNDDYSRVKDSLEALSPNEVGLKTFDYYFKNEIEF